MLLAYLPVMSAPALGRITRQIPDCVVDCEPSSSPVSMTLRIAFDPVQGTAWFRLSALATLDTSPEAFYLDISPDHISSLSMHGRGTPTVHLRFDVRVVHFIVPKRTLLRPEHNFDRAKLERLHYLALQPTLQVTLPEDLEAAGHPFLLQQLDALCDAVTRGGLRSDPRQADLKTLYRGQGGRCMQPDQELWAPPPRSTSAISPLEGTTSEHEWHASEREAPPPDLFALKPSNHIDLPPPSYPNVAGTPPPGSCSEIPVRKHKRRRTRSIPDPLSSDSLDTPNYNTYKHLDLVVGEREKMMAELVRRARIKERDLDAQCACAEDLSARLTTLISAAEHHVPKLQTSRISAVSAAVPASAYTAEGPASFAAAALSPGLSTASASSVISERVQAYVADKLCELRKELEDEYATREFVGQSVADEVDAALVQYVEDHQMFDAIREAIDEAVDQVRARMLQAWE